MHIAECIAQLRRWFFARTLGVSCRVCFVVQLGQDDTSVDAIDFLECRQASAQTGTDLLQRALSNRSARLAVVASAFDDVSCMQCMTVWLSVNAERSQIETGNFSAAEVSQANLAAQVASLCRNSQAFSLILRALKIFDPNNPLVDFVKFHRAFVQCRLPELQRTLEAGGKERVTRDRERERQSATDRGRGRQRERETRHPARVHQFWETMTPCQLLQLQCHLVDHFWLSEGRFCDDSVGLCSLISSHVRWNVVLVGLGVVLVLLSLFGTACPLVKHHMYCSCSRSPRVCCSLVLVARFARCCFLHLFVVLFGSLLELTSVVVLRHLREPCHFIPSCFVCLCCCRFPHVNCGFVCGVFSAI